MTSASAVSATGQRWWTVLIQGVAAILLGVLLLVQPGMTITGLTFWLGVYWVVVGVISIVHLIMGKTQQQRAWTLVKAVAEIVAGLFVLSYPAFSAAITSSLFLVTAGILAVVIGVVGVIAAIKQADWGIGGLAVLSVLIGLLLLGQSLLVGHILVLVVGIAAIIGGLLAIIAGWRMRAAA